ncbi:hypothetical protein NQ283_29215, partial [Escherichia coli]|nr:hypothetical protein [Escherichia coli]
LAPSSVEPPSARQAIACRMTDFIVLASLFALTFFGGVIVGYALRAIVSIRRRERAAGRLR